MAGGAPVTNSALIKCVCGSEQTDPAWFMASWSPPRQAAFRVPQEAVLPKIAKINLES